MMALDLAKALSCSGSERLSILWLCLAIFNGPTDHEGLWDEARELGKFVRSGELKLWVATLRSCGCPFIDSHGQWLVEDDC